MEAGTSGEMMSGITQTTMQAVNGIPFPEVIPDLVPEEYDFKQHICTYPKDKARVLTKEDIGKWVIRIVPTYYGFNKSLEHYPHVPTRKEIECAAIKVVNVVEESVIYKSATLDREAEARNDAAWLTVQEFFITIKPGEVKMVKDSFFFPD